MRSVRAAEWLLCFFVRLDEASPIAGDFSEEARERGALWYWFQVARTSIALFGRSLAEAPVRAAVLVLLGVLLTQMPGRIAIALMKANPYFCNTVFCDAVLWQGLAACQWVIAPLFIGYLLTRLADGREVTVCLALAAVIDLSMLGYWIGVQLIHHHSRAALSYAAFAQFHASLYLVPAVIWRCQFLKLRRRPDENRAAQDPNG
jgi:hypothetical protein